MSKRYSTLQKNVLLFYREYLKFAQQKEQPLRGQLEMQAKNIIMAHRDIPKRNVNRIEFLLRTEGNKLKALKSSNIT